MTPLYMLLCCLALRIAAGIDGRVCGLFHALLHLEYAGLVPGGGQRVGGGGFSGGGQPLEAFWRVTLRLALPAIAVAGLIAFLIGYTEFAIGWLFVESRDNVTLAMAVLGLWVSGGLEQGIGPGGVDEPASDGIVFGVAAVFAAGIDDWAGRRVGMEGLL